MIEVDFGEVMHRFYAGKLYGVKGPNYEDITWMESAPKPSPEELIEKWELIKDEVKTNRIAQARSCPGKYPSKEDLVVALWEMVVENKPEYVQKLQAIRESVKLEFPKD
jgi:hypothetical protein